MYFKQIDEIISGTKTQTRRVCKPNETEGWDGYVQDINEVYTRYLQKMKTQDTPVETYRIKWQVGRTYAVCPTRGKSGVWWTANGEHGSPRSMLMQENAKPLRIMITDIRREPLQDISENDARAEGYNGYPEINTRGELWSIERDVSPIEQYRVLWERINTRKGTRWEDNPDVWVLTFEVMRK